MNSDRLLTLVGFAAALIMLGVLVWLAGVDETISALQRAHVPTVGAVFGLAILWLAAWGMSLHTVLDAIGAPIPVHTAILVFSAAMFSNNITPFGQAGGEPVSAFLIAQATDSEYETGLAAIASVDTLHFIPSIGLAVVGLGVLVLRSVPFGRQLYVASASVVLLVAGFVTAAILGYRYRYEVEGLIVRVVTPLVRGLYRLVPTRQPPSPEAIQESVTGFFTAIDRIASDRRAVLLASTFSALGWIALSSALWMSVRSLGVEIPFAAALITIPIGSIAGVTPLPGGSGAIESAFAGLLVSIAGIANGVAVAAVLVHRIATYWFPTFVGGGVAAILGARRAAGEYDEFK